MQALRVAFLKLWAMTHSFEVDLVSSVQDF